MKIKTLTTSRKGHMIHHNGIFSSDSKWIVFDGRNDETKIGQTDTIGIVNIHTGEEKILYKTSNQTIHGPGVGAASFNPLEDLVVFIHGLYTANFTNPYDITRRFGLAVNLQEPMVGIQMDARDTIAPYTAGSLRGGTHSHCWSADGRLISFTYNDEFISPDLRVVGVMLPREVPVVVPYNLANNSGKMYSSIVTDVVREPKCGTDEISKAFDECWVGKTGYTNRMGESIKYAIAFQGNTINELGKLITEIYVVDIIPELILEDKSAVGEINERPLVPKGIQQRRLSYTVKGLSDIRHWLRSSADGQFIYALAKDDRDCNQIIQCKINSGQFIYITNFDFSIASPININNKSDKITFIASNNVYMFDIYSQILQQLTNFEITDLPLIGAPVFSPEDTLIAFNQQVMIDDEVFIQIKVILLDEDLRQV